MAIRCNNAHARRLTRSLAVLQPHGILRYGRELGFAFHFHRPFLRYEYEYE